MMSIWGPGIAKKRHRVFLLRKVLILPLIISKPHKTKQNNGYNS